MVDDLEEHRAVGLGIAHWKEMEWLGANAEHATRPMVLKSEFGVYIKALALGKLFEIFRAGGVVS